MLYGLMELYEIADIDPFDSNENFPDRMNIEMLDTNEQWLRRTMPKGIDLGPAFDEKRSIASLAFNDIWLATEYGTPTGRSIYNYLEHSVVSKSPGLKEWDEAEPVINHIAYTPTGESVILDMTTYVNQGSAPYKDIPIGSKTVKKIGCCVCSYAMVIGYYKQTAVTPQTVRDIISSYVNSDRNLLISTLLSANGYTFVDQNRINKRYPETSRIEQMVNLITEGKEEIPDIIIKTLERQIIESICWDSMEV